MGSTTQGRHEPMRTNQARRGHLSRYGLILHIKYECKEGCTNLAIHRSLLSRRKHQAQRRLTTTLSRPHRNKQHHRNNYNKGRRQGVAINSLPPSVQLVPRNGLLQPPDDHMAPAEYKGSKPKGYIENFYLRYTTFFLQQLPRCSQTGTTSFSFHIANPTAITTFTAPAIHNAVDIPTFSLLVQPPMIPPSSKVTTEAMRRFLLTFSLASKCGSETRSQYREVKTVVGTSLSPRSRDVTI